MSYRNVMIQEITNELTMLTNNKKNWNAKAISKSIFSKHKSEWKGSSAFVEYNCFENVKRLVTQVISKMASDKPDQDVGMQLIMPGCEHLQMHYMVDGIGIHIHNLTDEQIDQKAAFYDTMADTCKLHAEELREYKKKRA